MNDAPITRHIGTTERTLQALLRKHLSTAGISFPAWTALVFLSGAPLDSQELAGRLAAGKIAPVEEFASVVAELRDGNLIAGEDRLALSEAGREIYTTLRAKVDSSVAALIDGLPQSDIEATRRTLDIMRDRANAMLAV